jgi:WD40 repeat protein
MRSTFCLACLAGVVLGCGAASEEAAVPVVNNGQQTPADGRAQRPLDPVATHLRMKPIIVDAVRTVALSPDGKTLAAGNGTGEIQLWDVAEQKLLARWNAHGHWVFDLAFHPQGGQLLSAGGDGVIRLWSLPDHQPLKELVGHTDDVHGAAFVPNSDLILSGSDDATVRLWNLADGTHRLLGKHDKQVTAVAVSPDGNWGASSSRDGTARLWDLSTGEFAATLQGHTQDVLSVAFDRQGKRLVTASYDKKIGVWDAETHQRLHTLTGHKDWAFVACWGLDDQEIFSGGGDETLRRWRLDPPHSMRVETLGADVADVAIDAANNLVAVGLSNGKISIAKVTNGKTEILTLHAAPVEEAQPAPADARDK